MADITQSNWSETDASNSAAPPDGFPEGMNPSGVDDGMRAVMGALKRWYDWRIPVTTAGTTSAYTVSYSVSPTALADGMTHRVLFNAANTLSASETTINVNSLGAKNLRKFSGGSWVALAAGDILANSVHDLSYNSVSGTYRIISSASLIGAAFTAIANTFSALQTFSAGITMSASAINEAQAPIASAATVNIGAAAANYLNVTGTTTITAFDTIQAGTRRVLEFAGALTLTHNATSLILPTGASITTAAGDTAVFVSEGSGNWRCISYQKASGRALATPQTAKCYATNSGGTWTIAKGSGITSITTIATGSYEVTMATPMPDANYAASIVPAGNVNFYFVEDGTFTRTTTKFRFYVGGDNVGAQSPTAVNISVDSLT